jgi:diadenosine tetraphosphate (Ap4A) HIT family hydrolase
MSSSQLISLMGAMEQGIVPWKKDQVIHTSLLYCVVADGFPVTPGHLLFIPTWNSFSFINMLFGAAYDWGSAMLERGECAGFNVGLNCGAAAGQTIFWPHIHLIFRNIGDCADPRGGVRHCVPNGLANYLNKV